MLHRLDGWTVAGFRGMDWDGAAELGRRALMWFALAGTVFLLCRAQLPPTLAPFGMADISTTLPFWLGGWQRQAKVFAMVQSMNANQPFIMEVPNSEEYAEEFNIEGTVTFMAAIPII